MHNQGVLPTAIPKKTRNDLYLYVNSEIDVASQVWMHIINYLLSII